MNRYPRFFQRLALMLCLCPPCNVAGQTFDSGSDGSDGELVLTRESQLHEPDFDFVSWSVLFDPRKRGIDIDQDNVFHFTRIEINAGVTLKLIGPKLNMAPVYFLASDIVIIDGTIDLRGENSDWQGTGRHHPTLPGPGGWPGGVFTGALADHLYIGDGPGGGRSAGNPNHVFGLHTGNAYLLPLIGGSGGAASINSQFPCSGGAGGGALLIAATYLVSFDGEIDARGGTNECASMGGDGGTGASGAVNILASEVFGFGSIFVDAPDGGVASGGRTRIQRQVPYPNFINVFSNDPSHVSVVALSPAVPFLPAAVEPRLWIGSIDGAAPDTELLYLDYLNPHFSIDAPSSVPLLLYAKGLPPDTPTPHEVFIHIFNETELHEIVGPVPLVAYDGPPEIDADLTATIDNIEFPHGFSRMFVHAEWE